MNPEIKKDWLEALRSGEYKQGEHTLRDGDMYCCLGVLTDLYIKSEEGIQNDAQWNDYDVLLDIEVIEWAELDDKKYNMDEKNISEEDMSYDIKLLPENEGYETTLAGLNDNRQSFREISNIIEEQL